jgi:hypothetical protein
MWHRTFSKVPGFSAELHSQQTVTAQLLVRFQNPSRRSNVNPKARAKGRNWPISAIRID